MICLSLNEDDLVLTLFPYNKNVAETVINLSAHPRLMQVGEEFCGSKV